MYAMTCTRPDIAYAVGMLSRFTSNPSQEHWDALERLMRYLKGTLNYALCFSGHPPVLECYSDASWCSDLGDSRSTSGYVFTLGGAAVIWRSKRQAVIALSSMESELFALSSAGDEAEWVKDLLLDIPLKSLKMNSIPIFCDNQAAKTVATNSLYNGKRRNIRLKQAQLDSLHRRGYIDIVYVKSKENVADTLTKGLTREAILKTSGEMGLKAVIRL